MKGNRLYKFEKLCSRSAINMVFSDGKSEISYPLRAVFRVTDAPMCGNTPAQFLITIPKKKIRTAVGRVLMRRRVREAYRLNREILLPVLAQYGKSIDMAFLYLDTQQLSYAIIESRMKSLLAKIAADVEKIATAAAGDTETADAPKAQV